MKAARNAWFLRRDALLELNATVRHEKRISQLLVSPKAYARRQQLLSAFRWLRTYNPVARIEVTGFDAFWAVTRHSDILGISRNNNLFRNGDRSTTLIPREADESARALTDGNPHLIRSLVQMDEPEHAKYRSVVHNCFSLQSIRHLEEQIRSAARKRIMTLTRQADCEFVENVARPYALDVLNTVMGIDEGQSPKILRLTRQLFGSGEKRGSAPFKRADDPRRHAEMMLRVYKEFDILLNELANLLKYRARDSLVGRLANASINGCPMSMFEAASYLALLSTAGHDTTASAISEAVWALAEHPEELSKLKRDPTLITNLVEEAVRWATPVQHFMRTASADTELGSRKIAKGDWLMLCYLSGNRDEQAFQDPDRFFSDRELRPNVAFGSGAHTCLGRHLARSEIQIFFEELVPLLDKIEIIGSPQRSSSLFVGGPQRLPVRVRLVR